jgi:hypothetical protein
MDCKEIELDGMDWIEVTRGRQEWRALHEHNNEPSVSTQYLDILEYLED